MRRTGEPLVVVQAPAARRHADGPGRPWLFAAWMATGAAIAVVAGAVLGILAALEVSVGSDRWTQSVQAHGRLQLFGFVGTFTVALALEFFPRLLQRPAFPTPVRMLVPGSLAVGSLLTAGGELWHAEAGWLVVPGGLIFAAGAIAFAALAWRAHPPSSSNIDPQPLFLQLAASWLAAAGMLSLWSLSKADSGVIPLDLSRAVVETFLRGFAMLLIAGIALRAFVGHLGLRPPSSNQQFVILGMINTSLVVWLVGQGLGAVPEMELAVRLADVAYGLALLLFTGWFGVLAGLRRVRGAPTYAVLIPVAWTGLAIYALTLAGAAILRAPSDLDLYQQGAIRHIFLLGFMVPLMIGMAHIVLARFATGQLVWPQPLRLAFILVTVAWPLRVVPALVSDPPSDAAKGLMALAGVLLMAGLALVAATCARTALVVARRHRAAHVAMAHRPQRFAGP